MCSDKLKRWVALLGKLKWHSALKVTTLKYCIWNSVHVLGFLSQVFWKTKIFLISCFAVCILKRKKSKADGDMCF